MVDIKRGRKIQCKAKFSEILVWGRGWGGMFQGRILELTHHFCCDAYNSNLFFHTYCQTQITDSNEPVLNYIIQKIIKRNIKLEIQLLFFLCNNNLYLLKHLTKRHVKGPVGTPVSANHISEESSTSTWKQNSWSVQQMRQSAVVWRSVQRTANEHFSVAAHDQSHEGHDPEDKGEDTGHAHTPEEGKNNFTSR